MADDQEQSSAQLLEEEEILAVAGQYRLMWWRFRRHKVAVAAGFILLFFYILFPFAEFVGFGDPTFVATKMQLLPPQPLELFEDGKFSPHIVAVKGGRDPETWQVVYLPTKTHHKVGFFTSSWEYRFLGFFKTNKHLIGFSNPDHDYTKYPSLYILGSDNLGRDQWSRLMLASRISLSIGLIGVALSLGIGIIIGGVSGYYGGIIDTIIQRVIEIMNAIPGLPLWMGLSAAVPKEWSIIQVYLGITVILSVFGWTGMGRVVRGRYLAMREEDFVMAARLSGSSEARIMFRHMLPSFYSHIIATVSLAIPGMIIGETALSFLGLGLRPPAVSYGIMLVQAQQPAVVALHPWLMFVAIPVIIVILAFNFLGDGVRDAADPYGN
ncbi:MAG: peptide ABC transporter permease [Chloroflexi bacterium]|nr:peptide ABC transporter permease [Chloroflexota bacterium]MQG05958.1 ABC transporter permease [SAR202 cluster bacterium]|tara:strand:+ start:261 stop:1403 length:1143 start_codon:yes stop_codon:yes gene_type:complete